MDSHFIVCVASATILDSRGNVAFAVLTIIRNDIVRVASFMFAGAGTTAHIDQAHRHGLCHKKRDLGCCVMAVLVFVAIGGPSRIPTYSPCSNHTRLED